MGDACSPGTSLRGMVAIDWDLTRLVSNQTNANNTDYAGHPFDLGKLEPESFLAAISDNSPAPNG